MDTKVKWFILVIILAAVLGGGFYWLWDSQHAKQAKLDALAQCITQSGAKFYGAFWCPHCQTQKTAFNTLFSSGDHYLPYIECSTPDAKDQLEICKQENIKGYPTWKFADGTSMGGEISLDVLAAKTGCPLP